MFLLAYIGATLAGLLLVLRELLPLMQARRSGVIYTQGPRREKVARDTDPDRFEALCRKRRKAMTPGLILLAIGLFLVAQLVVGLLLMRP